MPIPLLAPSDASLKYVHLNFRRFNQTDFEEYKRYYADIDPVSDLSLNNSVVWLDINQDLEIAEFGGNVVFKYTCPFLNNDLVFSIVGSTQPIETIRQVFQYQDAHNIPNKIVMASQVTIDQLSISDRLSLQITEDTENFDYIYSVSDKANLFTPRAAKFRRTINRFIRDYGSEVTIKEVDLREPNEMNRLVNFLHIWKSGSAITTNDKLNIEGIAIDRYMQYCNQLKPQCVEVYVGPELVGFTIYHYPPQSGFAIINHIKCNYEYNNIFDFVFFCVMNRLKSAGIKYANGEQDLGIEGIRSYKHRLGPISYIKRYTIENI